MERLCFGTFIDILIQCKKENITKSHLTSIIIRSIDPKHKYDTSASSTRALNHLYKCTSDFTKTYSNIKELAPDTKKATLVKYFTKNVIPLIDTDKYELAVLALSSIIKRDLTIHDEYNGMNSKKFLNYISIDILNTTEFIFTEFLVDIFRYTVIEVKNTDGKEWLDEICAGNKTYDKFFENYVNNFYSAKDTIKVWVDTKQKEKDQSAQTSLNETEIFVDTKQKEKDQSAQTSLNETEIFVDTKQKEKDQFATYQNTYPCATISTPEKYHTCLYCEYFKAAKTVHKNVAGALGTCSFHEIKVSPIGGTDCNDFLPNNPKITHDLLLDGLPDILF